MKDVVYGKRIIDESVAFNVFGIISKEHYGVKIVEKVAVSRKRWIFCTYH
ncbi:MAG: hypothetical protein OEY17_06940 [Nitrosopumilus sp.]|nr:hypothetical protein [Nitrosopumilus sp.]